jgi:hypothetical protein
MSLGGPNIYPSSGYWMGVERMIHPIRCDANDDHTGPLWAVLAGEVKSGLITEMYFCESCTKTVQWARDNVRTDAGDTARLTFRGQEIICDELIISLGPVFNRHVRG